MKVDNTPLREAFLASGMSYSSVAKRAGYINKRGSGDGTTVARSLGLRHHPGDDGNQRHYYKNVMYDTALRLAEAMDLDPVDVGL